MSEITYDPDADAVYIRLALGKVGETAEAGPFIYDIDSRGRVLGIEILGASKVLAPGEWSESQPPGKLSHAAE